MCTPCQKRKAWIKAAQALWKKQQAVKWGQKTVTVPLTISNGVGDVVTIPVVNLMK